MAPPVSASVTSGFCSSGIAEQHAAARVGALGLVVDAAHRSEPAHAIEAVAGALELPVQVVAVGAQLRAAVGDRVAQRQQADRRKINKYFPMGVNTEDIRSQLAGNKSGTAELRSRLLFVMFAPGQQFRNHTHFKTFKLKVST